MEFANIDAAKMGAYHLADNPNIYEPYRGNAFEFLVYGLGEDDSEQGSNMEAIRMQVVSFPVAHFSLERKEIRRGNSVITFAGLPSFENGSLVVKDYVGGDGKSAIERWQQKAYNVQTDRLGNLRDYKLNCDVIEYDHTMEYKLRTWHLKGCWVSAIQEDVLTRESNEARNVTATIVYDKAIPDEATSEVQV